MAHSAGSFIGIQTAAKAPELFYAYIDVGQMSDQFKSEQFAYKYMLKQYMKNGDKNNGTKAKKCRCDLLDADLKLRDKAIHSPGIGTIHNMQ